MNVMHASGHAYTEELYKKDLSDPDNHDGVIWSQRNINNLRYADDTHDKAKRN